MAQQASKPNHGGIPKASDILANDDLVASLLDNAEDAREIFWALFGETGVLLSKVAKNDPSKKEELDRKVESGLVSVSDINSIISEGRELTKGLAVRAKEKRRKAAMRLARAEERLAQLRHAEQLRQAHEAEAMMSDDEAY